MILGLKCLLLASSFSVRQGSSLLAQGKAPSVLSGSHLLGKRELKFENSGRSWCETVIQVTFCVFNGAVL